MVDDIVIVRDCATSYNSRKHHSSYFITLHITLWFFNSQKKLTIFLYLIT